MPGQEQQDLFRVRLNPAGKCIPVFPGNTLLERRDLKIVFDVHGKSVQGTSFILRLSDLGVLRKKTESTGFSLVQAFAFGLEQIRLLYAGN